MITREPYFQGRESQCEACLEGGTYKRKKNRSENRLKECFWSPMVVARRGGWRSALESPRGATQTKRQKRGNTLRTGLVRRGYQPHTGHAWGALKTNGSLDRTKKKKKTGRLKGGPVTSAKQHLGKQKAFQRLVHRKSVAGMERNEV